MSIHTDTTTLLGAALEETGINYLKCYQCGKCTAGCPLRVEMDIPVSEVVRMVQRKDAACDERALTAQSIWICLGCETCSARCPQEVYPSEMMDFLRHESYRRGKVNPEGKRILRFHKAFLDSVKSRGRIYEVGLIANMKMGDALGFNVKEMIRDVATAPTMLAKGKLPLLGHKIKGTDEVAKIFKKCLGDEK